jgi:hypothetical protein
VGGERDEQQARLVEPVVAAASRAVWRAVSRAASVETRAAVPPAVEPRAASAEELGGPQVVAEKRLASVAAVPRLDAAEPKEPSGPPDAAGRAALLAWAASSASTAAPPSEAEQAVGAEHAGQEALLWGAAELDSQATPALGPLPELLEAARERRKELALERPKQSAPWAQSTASAQLRPPVEFAQLEARPASRRPALPPPLPGRSTPRRQSHRRSSAKVRPR